MAILSPAVQFTERLSEPRAVLVSPSSSLTLNVIGVILTVSFSVVADSFEQENAVAIAANIINVVTFVFIGLPSIIIFTFKFIVPKRCIQGTLTDHFKR